MKGPGVLLLLAISSACDQRVVYTSSILPETIDSYKKVGSSTNDGGYVRVIKYVNAGEYIEVNNYTRTNLVSQVTSGTFGESRDL